MSHPRPSAGWRGARGQGARGGFDVLSPLQARTISAWGLDAECAPSLPNRIRSEASSGGSVSSSIDHTALSTDGSGGEHATVHLPARARGDPTGVLVVRLGISTNQNIGNIGQDMSFGWTARNGIGKQNVAAYRPDVGDQTDGNVVVDKDGTDKTASVDYPDTNIRGAYSLVIDFEASETRFHVNTDPFTASPDATIAQIPGDMGKTPCAIIADPTSDGTGSEDSNEELRVHYAEYLHVPR